MVVKERKDIITNSGPDSLTIIFKPKSKRVTLLVNEEKRAIKSRVNGRAGIGQCATEGLKLMRRH